MCVHHIFPGWSRTISMYDILRIVSNLHVFGRKILPHQIISKVFISGSDDSEEGSFCQICHPVQCNFVPSSQMPEKFR